MFFIIITFILFTVINSEFWIFKHPRNKPINYRIEYKYKGKYVIYSKNKPFKRAKRFYGLLNSSEDTKNKLLIVDKKCNDVNIGSQLLVGQTSKCMIFNSYGVNKNLTQYVSLQPSSVDIKNTINTQLLNYTSNKYALIMDSGLDLNHCFFHSDYETHFYTYYDVSLNSATVSDHDKVVAYIKLQYSDFLDIYAGHGTHVCGIYGGKSCLNKNGAGPTNKFIFVDFGVGNNLVAPNNFVSLFGTLGAKYSSSSFGVTTQSYDYLAYQYDYYVSNVDDEYVHLVAAGNNCPNGYLSSPGLAKNVISIGSLNDDGFTISSYSCKTFDERIYPLVYLPGSLISALAETDSNTLHTSFITKTGTSMATPLAAAILHNITSRLEQLQITHISSSLLSATFQANLNKDRIFSNYKNNFFTNPNQWFFGDRLQVPVDNNYKKCYLLQPNVDFQAVLSWTEPPNEYLISDLDIMILFYNSTYIWGNHKTTSDIINNNEMIIIPAQKLNQTIQVMVSDTSQSLQHFSLTITSSSNLIEVSCNETCSVHDPPIECDYDEFGNNGYYLCGEDGTYNKTACYFHECDVIENSVLVNGVCVEANGTTVQQANNGVYIDNYLSACQEHCYLKNNICECMFIVPLLYTPPPSSSQQQQQQQQPQQRSDSSIIKYNLLLLAIFIPW